MLARPDNADQTTLIRLTTRASALGLAAGIFLLKRDGIYTGQGSHAANEATLEEMARIRASERMV